MILKQVMTHLNCLTQNRIILQRVVHIFHCFNNVYNPFVLVKSLKPFRIITYKTKTVYAVFNAMKPMFLRHHTSACGQQLSWFKFISRHVCYRIYFLFYKHTALRLVIIFKQSPWSNLCGSFMPGWMIITLGLL